MLRLIYYPKCSIGLLPVVHGFLLCLLLWILSGQLLNSSRQDSELSSLKLSDSALFIFIHVTWCLVNLFFKLLICLSDCFSAV